MGRCRVFLQPRTRTTVLFLQRLPNHSDRILSQRIERRYRLRISLKRSLCHDQVRELRRDINIRQLQRRILDRATSACSRHTSCCCAGGRGRHIVIIADHHQAFGVCYRCYCNLPDVLRVAITEGC